MEGVPSSSLEQFLDENKEIFDLKQDETDPLLTPMAELCVGQNPNGGQDQLIDVLADKQVVVPPEQQPPQQLPDFQEMPLPTPCRWAYSKAF